MDGKSLNHTDKLIAQLNQIIPEAFVEGKLDVDRLREILGEDEDFHSGRYQLTWPGKTEAYQEVQAQTTQTLSPDFAGSSNWDTAKNIFIEGENLDVLKVLQKSYFGKIKYIHIDPPYNTGTDRFIYSDNFTESKDDYLKKVSTNKSDRDKLLKPNPKESGRFHSNWLSMMLPRLFLARNLLREDGAILVHIDEHEENNLSILLNEVFGEDNLIGNMIWDKGNPKGDSQGIAYQHESLLVYARNKEKFLAATDLSRKKKNAERMVKKAAELFKLLGKVDIPAEVKKLCKDYDLPKEIRTILKREFTLEEINREFRAWVKKQRLSGGEAAYNKIDNDGNVFRLVSMAWPNKKRAPDDYFVPLVHPETKKPCPLPLRGWRFPTNTMKRLLESGEIVFGKDHGVQPQRKYLLKKNMSENLPSVLFYGGSDDSLLRKLDLEFENPKPVAFTKSLIEAFTSPDSNDIVLDFFAGSGTTAHAVLEANKADGGNRSFICIQLPEKIDEKSVMFRKGYSFISELTLSRIQQVINELNEAKDDAPREENGEIGFRSFKLSPSNFKIWRDDAIKTEQDLLDQITSHASLQEANASVEAMLWELILKSGLPLSEEIQRLELSDTEVIYLTKNKRMAFSLSSFSPRIQEKIMEINPSQFVTLDTLFGNDDSIKTNTHLKLQESGIEFKTL